MQPTKGTCETCRQLIRNCASMDFFPADTQIRTLLIDRLHRAARDHDHARKMIDLWLETATAAPKISDLVSLAGQVRSSGGDSLPAACATCSGPPTGYGGLFVFVQTDRGEATARCDCDRGRALQRLDQQREAA